MAPAPWRWGRTQSILSAANRWGELAAGDLARVITIKRDQHR